MDIQNLSIDELLFDRQESFNDIVSLLVAERHGIGDNSERLEGNLKIINTIRIECKRRGFDPAQLDQVMKVQNEIQNKAL